MPGNVFVAYVPAEVGPNRVEINALDKKGLPLVRYNQAIENVDVRPNSHTVLFVSKYVKYDRTNTAPSDNRGGAPGDNRGDK
jgi:hypothetical protein